jgi:hypothetical protein
MYFFKKMEGRYMTMLECPGHLVLCNDNTSESDCSELQRLGFVLTDKRGNRLIFSEPEPKSKDPTEGFDEFVYPLSRVAVRYYYTGGYWTSDFIRAAPFGTYHWTQIEFNWDHNVGFVKPKPTRPKPTAEQIAEAHALRRIHEERISEMRKVVVDDGSRESFLARMFLASNDIQASANMEALNALKQARK